MRGILMMTSRTTMMMLTIAMAAAMMMATRTFYGNADYDGNTNSARRCSTMYCAEPVYRRWPYVDAADDDNIAQHAHDPAGAANYYAYDFVHQSHGARRHQSKQQNGRPESPQQRTRNKVLFIPWPSVDEMLDSHAACISRTVQTTA